MNKERMELVTMTRDVVRAGGDTAPTRRMARVIEARLDSLIAAETRAITQMENYKDRPTTAVNYEIATEALGWLNVALEAAIDEDWEQVDTLLSNICDPEQDSEE